MIGQTSLRHAEQGTRGRDQSVKAMSDRTKIRTSRSAQLHHKLHKIRNLADHLPEKLRSTVTARMWRAYHADSALGAGADGRGPHRAAAGHPTHAGWLIRPRVRVESFAVSSQLAIGMLSARVNAPIAEGGGLG